MPGILSLKPEDKKRLYPEALKWFNDQRATIQREVPLEELSDDDLNIFLSDDEKREFQTSMDEIAKGLARCINTGRVSPDLLTNIGIGLNSLQFQVGSLLPMHNIRLLLKKVYERKREEQRNQEEERKRKVEEGQRERYEEDKRSREQAEAERRKKEDEERWWAAYKGLNIPTDDAFKYLKTEEHEKFLDSILEAVDAYLARGKCDILDRRANDYLVWISVINNRRKKEQERITANLAAQEYNQRLNKEIARLKSLLYSNRIDHESYFRKEVNDSRYTGQSFTQFLSREEEWSFDRMIATVSRKRLDEIVPNDFRQFIDRICRRSYFLLPSADYSFEEVPCLDFMFDVFAVVETGVWLKPREKTFGDYAFNLPVREEKGYSILLQEPELLGYHYLVLTPKDLGGYSFWQSIPLVLLEGLLSGQTRPNGTTISAASDGMITYKIPNFKEEVTIPDSFAGYLKYIGNIDQMVSIGIITEKIASVAKNEVGEQKASPLDNMKSRNSKKAKAFQLFSEGKRPSDSEVKTLGIKPESAYRYYQQWKKLVIVGNIRI